MSGQQMRDKKETLEREQLFDDLTQKLTKS